MKRSLITAMFLLALSSPCFAALPDNLAAFWSFDEASGNAIDAHAANDGTETSGTIAADTGKLGGCRTLVAADTEYFEVADSADVSSGDVNFSWAGWLRIDASGAGDVLNKWESGGNQREYWIDITGANHASLNVSADGSSGTNNTTGYAGPMTTGTWYFVAFGHSASANEIWVSINGAAPTVVAHTTGVFDSTTPLRFGTGPDGSPSISLDEWGLWKRDIRSDLAALYNSGTGMSYGDITGGTVSLGGASYYRQQQ